MNETSETQLKDRYSAQEIFQKSAVLANYQARVREYPKDKRSIKMVVKLRNELLPHIRTWGGIKQVDKWLRANDPHHSIPSDIKSMDWTWLPEELRPSK